MWLSGRLLAGLSLVAALALAGCTTPAPAPPAPVAAPVPAAPPPPAPQSPAARQLLQRAEAQIAANLLTSPPGDNALETLAQALALEPTQPDTQRAVFRGRERIAESYLALAEKALQRRERVQAERLLERAAEVDPAHLGLPAMRERLRLAQRERVRSVPLAGQDLAARSEPLRQVLVGLGREAKAGRGFVLIRARSDAEGRWIYDQLNRAPGGRLRAEIRRAGSPGLEITTWDNRPASATAGQGTGPAAPLSTHTAVDVPASEVATAGIPVDAIPGDGMTGEPTASPSASSSASSNSSSTAPTPAQEPAACTANC
jgi:hypothetical protein